MVTTAPNDSQNQMAGLSGAGTSDMPGADDSGMPADSGGLPPQTGFQAEEPPSEFADEIEFSDDQIDYLKSEAGQKWARQHGYLTETQFQLDKANLQSALANQVNQALRSREEVVKERNQLEARTQGLISVLKQLSEEHGFEFDAKQVAQQVATFENADTVRRQKASEETTQTAQAAVQQQGEQFWNYFQQVNQAVGGHMNAYDPTLGGLLGQYQQAFYQQELSREDEFNFNQSAARTSQAYNELIAHVQRMAMGQNQQQQQPPPAEPNQQQQQRLPQRSARGGGGSRGREYSEILDQLVKAADNPTGDAYNRIVQQAYMEYQRQGT